MDHVAAKDRLQRYRPFRPQVDLSRLSSNERAMLPALRQAADAMEMPFWIQEYGEPEALLASITDPDARRLARVNFGPWDRASGDEPFLPGIGEKPSGANYYPPELTAEEFEAAAQDAPALKSAFTMVRRNESGELIAIPYHEFFREHVQAAAEALRRAAGMCEQPEFNRFLTLRVGALLDDDYRLSDMAWMDLRESTIDILIGPMEVEDRLFGIKTAYSAAILVKDHEASAQLSGYVDMLPEFQESLPAPAAYKGECPGMDADLQVYDALHFAGLDRCALPRGVAWPNDEAVQMSKGVRSMLLRNVMQAKFEAIFLPLADLLIAPDQRHLARPEGDLRFVMCHELAHGLGVKRTLDGVQTVRAALGAHQHAIEEAKADMIGLHIAGALQRAGELSEGELLSVYVTSLVGLLYNYDARQAVMRMNYFKEMGAYARDAGTGTYHVHPEKMGAAVEALVGKLLRIQGDGDRDGAQALLARYGVPDGDFRRDIERIEAARLPLGLYLQEDK